MHRSFATTYAKWTALVGIALLVGSLSSLAQQCGNQVSMDIFCDDFGPDSRQRWIAPGGSSLSISEGKGRLTGTNVPYTEPRGVGSQSNVSIQTVGRLLEGLGLGVGARSQGGFNYYVYVGGLETGQQGYALERGGDFIEPIHAGESTFSVFDEPVAMQFDLFGDQLSYWVWPADEARPAEPIATITDARQSSGTIFLYTGDIPFENRGTAEFDYIRIATEHITTYEPVPEPSALGAMLLGATVAAPFRRFRYSRRWS